MQISSIESSTEFVSVQDLAYVLERSESLVRMVANSFDVDISAQGVALGDALELLRYFAFCNAEQDKLLSRQNAKLQGAKARELEHAIALEIVKRERCCLEDQVKYLTNQLERENWRNERLEQKLDELMASFAHLVSQRDCLVAQAKIQSKVTVRQHKGREVLYLEQPVNRHLVNWEDR